MKKFFLEELKTLRMRTGAKQYEELLSIPDERKSKIEINALLNELVYACHSFTYIPDESKKGIIHKRIIEDPEFFALNPKFVYKCLSQVRDVFYKESHHTEVNETMNKKSNAKPLSEETQTLINKFMADLASGTVREVPKVSKFEIEKIQKEDQERATGRVASKWRTDETYALLREKKMEAAKKRGLDKLGLHELKTFEIEGKIIVCRNEEEAQEIFIEVYS